MATMKKAPKPKEKIVIKRITKYTKELTETPLRKTKKKKKHTQRKMPLLIAGNS